MKLTISKPKNTVPFTMLMQSVTLAMTKEMSPAASKLLLYLMCSVEYMNIISKPSTIWADELNYSKRQILRAISELLTFGILFKSKHPSDKRISVYTINPLQSWKGTEVDRRKTVREYDKTQLDLFQNLPEHSEERRLYKLAEDKYLPKKITESDQRKTMERNRYEK